ncbi:patatin-like phospholipase domain-containing protein 7a [Tachysurus ichikawai]
MSAGTDFRARVQQFMEERMQTTMLTGMLIGAVVAMCLIGISVLFLYRRYKLAGKFHHTTLFHHIVPPLGTPLLSCSFDPNYIITCPCPLLASITLCARYSV